MNLNYIIDAVITISIIIFFIWLFMLISVIGYNIFNIFVSLFEKHERKNNTDDNIIRTIIDIFRFCLYPLFIYLCLLTVILSFIFWIWLFIIYFVPHLVFIGIIPIPLKIPILEFVPPFKALTDKGILPLIRRINSRLIDFFISKNSSLHNDNLKDLYNYVYEEVIKFFKLILKAIFIGVNYDNEIDRLFPKKDPIELKEVENNIDPKAKEEEDEARKINDSYNEDEDKIKIKNLINEEIAICINNKSKLRTSDLSSSDMLFQSQQNLVDYAECYAKSLNTYIGN